MAAFCFHAIRPLRSSSVVAGFALLLGTAPGAATAADSPAELRVRHVSVFSSGVAYFESQANVEGDTTAELNFRTDQINDILKSLLVSDSGGGSIGVVSYASRDPVEKALRSFSVDITGKPTLAQLLDQLRGEPVEIAAPRAASGVILGVERQKVAVKDGQIDVDVVNVLTQAGIEQFRIQELTGIRLANAKVDAELRKALAVLAASHDADKKTVVLRFAGSGKRDVRIAYLLEAPIWKTSYRLAMRDGEKPLLQGWAMVENATEEDWRDVRLSLVSGRPISFTMDLYTPLYVPRPEVELELYASLRPPTFEGHLAKKEQAPAAAPAAPAPATSARAGRTIERLEAGQAGTPRDAGKLSFGFDLSGVGSVADAAEAGELFEYTIQTPVSIARQQSAMLPIVNQAVEGEKVSVFNPEMHPKHPLNGLQITNTSGLHLMQGPVTVFEGGVYGGDARLPDLKPDEQRLIAYALDLGAEARIEQHPARDELLSVRISKGTFWHTRKFVDSRTYVLKNKTQRPKTIFIEQRYGDEWKLVEPQQPDERTSQLSRFRVALPPGQTLSQKVELQQTRDQSVALSNLGGDQIEIYLRAREVSPKVKEALERLVAMRSELDAAARQRQRRETDIKEAEQEQERVRKNLQALEKNTDAYARQQKKLDELETRIEELRDGLTQDRALEEQKRADLERFLLSLEVS
jgi:hypothetical protein